MPDFQAVAIIPTIGRSTLRKAVDSVLAQTVPTRCYVVCDGPAYQAEVAELLAGLPVSLCVLPFSVGADGFYGHRVYASFPRLVDEPHVLMLDDDNWFDEHHVHSCLSLIESQCLLWAHSLRKICAPSGEFLCNDDCQSLGKWKPLEDYHLIDTSTWCIRRDVLLSVCKAWHGKWGQDRWFTHVMMKEHPHFDCTGQYTVNYRLDGNLRSATPEFFKRGNLHAHAQHGERLPWQKEPAGPAVDLSSSVASS
jgi:hypothetical protein